MTPTSRWFPDHMPLPAADDVTRPWWEAAAAHRLVVQYCTECGRTRHPPAALCPSCRGDASDWLDVPGTGTVYTYSIVHQAFVPALADQLPYVVAVVDLDGSDGCRLVTNLVDTDPQEVSIDMPITIVWEDMGPALAVPRAVSSPTPPEIAASIHPRGGQTPQEP